MMADIRAVMWKESKGLFRYRGSRWRFALAVFAAFAIAALYFPLQIGRDWVDSPLVLTCLMIPLMLVSMTIPESFAGEREQHTLATLLASRLPDRAILLGKLVVSIAFGWGMTLFSLLVSLVAVNVANWDGYLLMYSPAAGLAAAGLSLLMTIVMSGAGVLISMRSARAQEARQMLNIAVMVPAVVAGLVAWGISGKSGLPSDVSFADIALIIGAILAVIGAALIALAMARFRRARLILD
jgi:ABC-2 type transport system permease protein